MYKHLDGRNKGILIDFKINPKSEDPATANLVEGIIWYNTTEKKLKIFDGSKKCIINTEFSNFFSEKNYYRGSAPYPFTPVDGDLWDELDAGTGRALQRWNFRSPFWASDLINLDFYSAGLTATAIPIRFFVEDASDIFLEKILIRNLSSILYSAGNTWTFSIARATADTSTNIDSLPLINYAANNFTEQSLGMNLIIPVDALNVMYFQGAFTRAGSPGTLSVMTKFFYRLIRK